MKHSDCEIAATRLLVLERGDEVVATILGFCRSKGIRGAWVQAIGAVEGVEIGAYDRERQAYVKARPEGVWELLALSGNVAVDETGAPVLHAHVVLGDEAGQARGGHLFEARCAVTVEVVLTVFREPVHRRLVPAVGLKLWDL